MIITTKTIDYKNVKLTDKELQDFCKKMGIVTDKDLKERHPNSFKSTQMKK